VVSVTDPYGLILGFLDRSSYEQFFFNVPTPSGRTRTWVYSAYNRNEYQKHRNNVSGE
jgi:hypothetical protein